MIANGQRVDLRELGVRKLADSSGEETASASAVRRLQGPWPELSTHDLTPPPPPPPSHHHHHQQSASLKGVLTRPSDNTPGPSVLSFDFGPPMHPMLHDRSQFPPLASPSSASSASGYFSHLQRQAPGAPPPPGFGPHPGISVVQRSYLPLSESTYAQNFIQIGHFPPHLLRPAAIQYPGYLSPFAIGGREAAAAKRNSILPLAAQMIQNAHRRPPPAGADPFQRSPRPDSRTTWSTGLGGGGGGGHHSPGQAPYKDHRSPTGQSPVHPGRNGGHWTLKQSPVSSSSVSVKKSPPSEAGGHGETAAGSLRPGGPSKDPPATEWGLGAVPAPECKILPLKQVPGGGSEASPARSGTQAVCLGGGGGGGSSGTSIRFPGAASKAAAGGSAMAFQDQPHYPHHFSRGSVIQLVTGQLKYVEDLKTSDFLESAHFSSDLQIDSSTVIHMRQNHERNTVVLGFAVGKQNIQVTVEATLEHPFFVFDQGWSSYSPEKTLVRYGLQCHQLVVGNSCVSLTPRGDEGRGLGSARGSTARVNPIAQEPKLEPGEIPSSFSHDPDTVEGSSSGGGAGFEPPPRKVIRREGAIRCSGEEAGGKTPTPAGRIASSSSSSLVVSSQKISSSSFAKSLNFSAASRSPPFYHLNHHNHHHHHQALASSGMSPGAPRDRKRRRWSSSDARCATDGGGYQGYEEEEASRCLGPEEEDDGVHPENNNQSPGKVKQASENE